MQKENMVIPKHVAIIMDGNGRWAKKRLMPVSFGHSQGAKRLQDVLEVGQEYGINTITLYAFSTENWKRSEEEINHILGLIDNFYEKEMHKLIENEIKILFIGSDENIPQETLIKIKDMEKQTANFKELTLNIAFNYGAKEELIHAVNEALKENKKQITEEDINNNLYTKGQPDVDLLIRTSGEERISNFLLWQCAYAEFIFEKKLWPDFNKKVFIKCLEEFSSRNRRFGGR